MPEYYLCCRLRSHDLNHQRAKFWCNPLSIARLLDCCHTSNEKDAPGLNQTQQHYPLTEPTVSPLIKYLWKKGYAIMTGTITTTTVAIVAEYCGTLPCMAASAEGGIFLSDKSVSILFCILINRSCNGFLLLLSIKRSFCRNCSEKPKALAAEDVWKCKWSGIGRFRMRSIARCVTVQNRFWTVTSFLLRLS